jgi:putative transposase
MKFLTRKGFLIEEQGMTYLADTDLDITLGPLRAAACTYRIALGPRAGQKVLSLQTVPTQEAPPTPGCCASEQGFSLHAEVCCAAHQRKKLGSQGQGLALLGAPRTQHLCRYITRPAIANERLTLNRAGQVVLTLKTPYRDGTTHIVMSPLEFIQRLAALVPRPRLLSSASTACSRPTPSYVPTSFRTCPSTPIPPQRTTLRCPLPRRLPP